MTNGESYAIETKVIQEAFPNAEIVVSGRSYREDAEKYAESADAVLVQVSMQLDAPLIAQLEKCKIISVYGVGYDNVDVDAATAKGIAVANVPGYCTEDVSDYVIAAIYHCNKTLLAYAKSCRGGAWGAMAAKHLIHRIAGSKLLIIGLGRIGGAVAAKAKAMRMEVLCYDPYVSSEQAQAMGVKAVSLEDGLAQADYVSLNMRLTEETKGFLSTEAFRQMKPTAYLINASRGGTVDEAALIEAVQSGEIAGACLDVLCEEPPKPDNPMLHTDGIFCYTPYLLFNTVLSGRIAAHCCANAVAFLRGEPVASVVNPEAGAKKGLMVYDEEGFADYDRSRTAGAVSGK